MLNQFLPEEQAVLYGVTGGIPEYLARIQENQSLDENIVSMFFEESGRLFEEPSYLLKQELKEPATYHSMISAIAGGANRMNEIATKTGLESSGCSNQITSLISLGIVRKEFPMTENPAGKKTLYRLEDSMFLFWYRFVRPNLSSIIRGSGETVYQTLVKPRINDFMGSVFEDMCQQYLYLPAVYSTLPFAIGNVGRWWGNNSRKKRQEEIDLMAVWEKDALFCECKWTNTPLHMDTVKLLEERSRLFHYTFNYYFYFSKSGFTDAVHQYAEGRNIRLVSFEDFLI